MKRLILIAMVVLMSSSIALAQDICESDFTCDGDVDAADVSTFLEDFGRSEFFNPCPPCVPPVMIPKSGQTGCYDTLGNPRDCAGSGEDGEHQLGYERFTDNGDGTVTDNFTMLIWLQDVNCMATHYPDFDQDIWGPGSEGDGDVTWQHALDFVEGINDGTYPLCGEGFTDWRLPNVNELLNLATIPLHYHFVNYDGGWFWSSTTLPTPNTDSTYKVALTNPVRQPLPKNSGHYFVIPVRGGH